MISVRSTENARPRVPASHQKILPLDYRVLGRFLVYQISEFRTKISIG